jgi:uroporphyrin-III C-methyltransferase
MRIPLASSKPHSSHAGGHVTLVGGGPGDADLMTVAGRDALANADVVLHDRLGPRDDLHLLAPAARLIDVGKTPGHHAVPQREIERLLLDNALDGHHVVRLKGGDPFVFGRGGEEVIACRSAGIPVTVIPGVTSAIAVPGAAGIPVTHREISRAFTVISGHVPLSENELEHAVGLGGTLVILMGVANLPHLTAGLQRHGMRRDMPLAVLERGFTPSRRTTLTTLSDAVRTASATGVASPAVIVIGEVVDALGDPEFAASLAEFA